MAGLCVCVGGGGRGGVLEPLAFGVQLCLRSRVGGLLQQRHVLLALREVLHVLHTILHKDFSTWRESNFQHRHVRYFSPFGVVDMLPTTPHRETLLQRVTCTACSSGSVSRTANYTTQEGHHQCTGWTKLSKRHVRLAPSKNLAILHTKEQTLEKNPGRWLETKVFFSNASSERCFTYCVSQMHAALPHYMGNTPLHGQYPITWAIRRPSIEAGGSSL